MLFKALLLLGAGAGGLATTLPAADLGKAGYLPKPQGASIDGLIIKFKHNAKLARRNGQQSAHVQFHKRAALASFDYTVRTEFSNENLFSGLSINLEKNMTESEVEEFMSKMPEVEGFWPLEMVPKPGPAPGTGNLTDEEIGKSRMAVFGPEDDDSKLPEIKGADVTSTHRMTGVDKLHKEGVKGKGVKIGIIDTGVDYRHPALGGGFGPGFKIAGGYSFLDDEWDRFAGRDPIESDDPFTSCAGNAHGTHVAGIVGMTAKSGQGFAGLFGAAPEASIYMYKVFSCLESGTAADIIMNAMVKAVEDGVDVISMSLGGSNFFAASSPYYSLIKAINEKGVGLVVSNGNDGKFGIYNPSTPADGPGVIAVGSITNSDFPVSYRAKDSNGKCFQYASVWPLEAPELKVHYHGDTCTYEAWQATGKAVTAAGADNIIVIAETHSKCPLSTQMSASSSFRVKNLLAFTSESLDPSPFNKDIEIQIPFPSVATIVVPPRTGQKLVANVKKNADYKLKFGKTKASGLKLEFTGGLMSNFSSFGPSWDLAAVKPSLSAPGGKILSTWPLGTSAAYAIISGTSMAAPLVAGCWALVKSQKPDMSAAEIGNLLQSSSTPVSYVFDKSILSSVAHQGSGMVNCYNAIKAQALVTPSEAILGDIDDFEGKAQTIQITNTGSSAKTFTISHQGAGYAEVFPYPDLLEPNSWFAYGQPQYAIYGSSKLPQTSITVEAGKTAELKAYISPPELTSAQLNKVPLMSGFFQLESSDETHTIPYLAAPYSRQDKPGFDTTVLDYTGGKEETFSEKQPFVYCGSCISRKPNSGFDVYNGTVHDFPSVYFNIITGIKHFQVNIVPANTTFKPTHHGGNPPKDSGYEYIHPNVTAHDEWMGMPSYGWIADSAQRNNPRPREVTANWYPYQSDALFRWAAAYYHTPDPDGTTFEYLPNGDYRFLLSLLKPGSDADNLAEWETYLGPVMRMVGDNY
ncbi:subtilase family protein [Sarocladium implicatum]|nr:subtilase family protein [Sarocladium implicatum]